MAYWCGVKIIKKDGEEKQCLHRSRRNAIDCTRRAVQVDLINALKKAELLIETLHKERAVAEEEIIAKNSNIIKALSIELNNNKIALNNQAKEIDLLRQICDSYESGEAPEDSNDETEK